METGATGHFRASSASVETKARSPEEPSTPGESAGRSLLAARLGGQRSLTAPRAAPALRESHGEPSTAEPRIAALARPQDAILPHKMVFVEVLHVDPQLFLALPPSYLPSAPLASSSLAGGVMSHLGFQLSEGRTDTASLSPADRAT